MSSERELDSPAVYIGIIDNVGRRLYSGNITWLREYIQNSIDSGATEISITLRDNDLEISDDGKGMNKSDLISQAFSLGRSFKSAKEIGELGVGIFAGSGTCDKIVVLTKKDGYETMEATLDMNLFRQINKEKPKTTFEEGMRKILAINPARTGGFQGNLKQFTRIRFENLNKDTIQLVQKEDLGVFIENTVDLPINDRFPHKKNLEEFLGKDALNIKVRLTMGGETKELTKFSPNSIIFADTFWAKPIEINGKVKGKIWATYNKAGESFYGNGIRVKRKGLTVGDPKYVESKFFAKYSDRFYGEIIILDDNIEINTSRDWFVSSTALNDFVSKTRTLLNELWGIANFDSKQAVGIINLLETNKNLKVQAEKAQEDGNLGTAKDKREKIEMNNNKIEKKLQDAISFKQSVERGEVDLSDPTNKMKSELVNRTLSSPEVKKFQSKTPISDQPAKRTRQNPFPEIVRTFLKENIIDKELSNKIGSGDVKDTTDRAFTFIELKLKTKIGKKQNEHVDWNKVLIPTFINQYEPPDYEGLSKDKQREAFAQIMGGFYTFLRNQSAHTFMDDMNNTRNLFQIILISDFMVSWIDQWTKKP